MRENYNDKYYSSFANVNKLDPARKRFAEWINIGESSVVKRKKGRPPLTGETTSNESEFLELDQRLRNMTKPCV